MKNAVPIALTIAGSDPSGGAGIQADLKVFHQHQTYGMSVITLLTVQNTRTVEAVMVLEPNFVLKQLDAVLMDIPPHAAKTGALGNAEIIDMLSWKSADFSFPLVIDPVMISKHGSKLLDDDGAELLKKKLLRGAALVTPNIPEAEYLSERHIVDTATMKKAAKSIALLGPASVLIKGGHLQGSAEDVLYFEGNFHHFPGEHIETKNTHGTGCVFSSAITARLAQGELLAQAVAAAKRFIVEAIRTNPQLGSGFGPTNMHALTSGMGEHLV